MKFEEYVENLQKILKDKPELADVDVVYSKDDEGNGFGIVHYTPTVGYYDETDREFMSADDEDNEENEINSICVN